MRKEDNLSPLNGSSPLSTLAVTSLTPLVCCYPGMPIPLVPSSHIIKSAEMSECWHHLALRRGQSQVVKLIMVAWMHHEIIPTLPVTMGRVFPENPGTKYAVPLTLEFFLLSLSSVMVFSDLQSTWQSYPFKKHKRHKKNKHWLLPVSLSVSLFLPILDLHKLGLYWGLHSVSQAKELVGNINNANN